MSEEIISRRFQLSSFQIIILGFAGVILLGALLLMLPIATQEGCVTPFHDALFTATSAVCVTGLVIHDTGSYWSAFGQTIILTLIQIGGLGVVTVAASFALLSRRRISLMQRTTLQDAISAPNVGGIVRLTKFILWGTFLIELIGALAMLPVFCCDYGWGARYLAGSLSLYFCLLQCRLRYFRNCSEPLPLPYRLRSESYNKYNDYAAHHNWRYRLFDLGGHLRKQAAVPALQNAEQGNPHLYVNSDYLSGNFFLLC